MWAETAVQKAGVTKMIDQIIKAFGGIRAIEELESLAVVADCRGRMGIL